MATYFGTWMWTSARLWRGNPLLPPAFRSASTPPVGVRDRLLTLAHISLTIEHPGITSTTQSLSKKYWGPTLVQDDAVSTHVNTMSTHVQCEHNLNLLGTLQQVAEALFQQVFQHYGLPGDIAFDRGPQFTSHVWSTFMEKLGVTVSLTSGYRPQSNGQVERMNQELGRFLMSHCQDRQ
ncbi:uncharacterized protein ACWYII_001254 isoform 1-T2 [Salvelinus alpinus]